MVCDKMVYERWRVTKWFANDGVQQRGCVTKLCVKDACERWSVTKLCDKDGVRKSGVC